MAFHTKKEFSELCGIKTKELAVYISRGKVVMSGEYIDDKNEANASFLRKFSEKKKASFVAPSVPAPFIPETPSVIKEERPFIPEVPRDTSSAINPYMLERETKIAELEKKRVDIRIAKLKEDKLMGDLIPTDLVRSLIMLQSESTKFAFNEGCENLIVLIAQKKQLNATEVADIRSKLSALINKCIDNSISFSTKKLKTIVTEYSQKRDVGDHD